MADQADTSKFPEDGVERMVRDAGKKAPQSKVDEIKALARQLKPQQQKVQAARILATKQQAQSIKKGRSL